MRTPRFSRAIKSVALLGLPLTFEWVVRILYLGTALIHAGDWYSFSPHALSLIGPLVYPTLPEFLFTDYVHPVMKVLFLVTACICGLGFFQKSLSIICFAAAFMYFLLSHAAGLDSHHHYLPCLFLLILALHFNLPKVVNQRQLIFLLRLSFCLVFFTAGLAKLKHLQLDWFDEGRHLYYLLRARYVNSSIQAAGLDWNRLFIIYFEWIKWLFFATLPLELISPLALKARFRFIIWFIAVMQYIAGKVLFAVFYSFIPLYSIWLNIKYSDFSILDSSKSNREQM